ncbi:MAG: hypothetical protein KatS3mg132_486 [Limisphaera sp.]|nr:MAG: hypothetical protein KatS3mg132_486 [Limisphaera sp.]
MWRRWLFWIHLVAGVVAGAVILVMSLTGALIAFEKQLVAWAEGANRRAELPGEGTARLSLQSLVERLRTEQGGPPLAMTIHADPSLAVEIMMGRDELFYWDPYTGELRPASARGTRSVLRALTSWHRWLGLEGERRSWGKAVTGACNLAFVVLILTGAVLWWPSGRGANRWRMRLWFRPGVRGRARDWHWHHVLGLWCGPVLLVLSGSAIVISYAWAARWVQSLGSTGEREMRAPAAEVRSPEATVSISGQPATLDEIWARVCERVPDWQTTTIRFGATPRGRPGTERSSSPGGSSSSVRESERPTPSEAADHSGQDPSGARPEGARSAGGPSALSFVVREKGAWPVFATIQIVADARSGQILSVQTFSDQPLGRRLRAWLRYLHTGEALGWPGQLVAMIASLGAVVLVWTGLALSWRRFFVKRASVPAGTAGSAEPASVDR